MATKIAPPDPEQYCIPPRQPIRLADFSPDDAGEYGPDGKEAGKEELKRQRKRLIELQDRLFAEEQRSLLVVVQATDAGGKDGTVKKVFKGTMPQGVRVYSFKTPTGDERAHDFLWRYHEKAPGAGMIHIHNRSHYEDVVSVRVKESEEEERWRSRYESINDFEHMLAREGTTILKFFLHLSKDEQKRRFEKRVERPDKRWKFNPSDLEDRELWDEFERAYEDAISLTSTDWAPWYVIPADHKWYRNIVIARTIADTLEALDPQYPEPAEDLDKIKIPD